MSIVELLKKIDTNNISISLKNGADLEISFDKDNMPNENFIEEIKQNKEGLIGYLNTESEKKVSYANWLTPFQEGLASFAQNHSTSNRYVIQFSFKVGIELDFDIFKKSCDKLVLRHDILRSTFDYDLDKERFESQISQTDYIDCNHIASEEGVDIASLKEPFDITKGQLIRFTMIGNQTVVVTLHHLIIDLTSIHVLLEELFEIYSNISEGKAEDDGMLAPVQFSSYVQWILEKNKDEALNYWKQVLHEKTPTLLETVSVPEKNSATNEFKEAVHEFSLNSDAIKYIRSNGMTVSTALNFIGGMVLGKYYGGSDFIWGNTITHRYEDQTNFQDVVGPCLATIPLVYDFGNTSTVKEAIQEFQKQLLSSREYSYVSLNEIYKTVESKNLFSALFSFQDHSAKVSYDGNSLDVDRLKAGNNVTSHFPMTFLFSQLEENLEIKVSYRSDLFSNSMIDNITTTIVNLFNKINTYKDHHIADLNLFDISEAIQSSIIEGPTTKIENDAEANLISRFRKSVEMFPDNVAVRNLDGEEMTYTQLDQASNFIMNSLLSKEITGGVGVRLEHSFNMVASVLGIMKAGCYVVSMEFSYPMEKLQWIEETVGLKACVTEEGNAINMDMPDFFNLTIPEEIPLEEAASDLPNIKSTDICALHYTSGSTGTPKIVKVDHTSFLNRFDWLNENFAVKQEDVFCLKTKLSFAPSIREIFEPLHHGASLYVMPEYVNHDLEKFIDFVQKSKVSKLFLTPSFIKLLLENEQLNHLSGLQILEISGEPIRMDVVKKVKEQLPTTQILNRYGATESASVVYNINIEAENEASYFPLGHPIQNTSVRIVDEKLNVKPKGIIGEIVIQSKSLALGYYNEEDDNDKFVNLGAEGDETFLRTGDVGYISEDGVLHYKGRQSRMVKIRGFRVEPREIEYNLEQHENIEKVVALPIQSFYSDQIVAFCQLKDMIDFDELNIKFFLKDKLPAYMIPNKIVALDKFPLTNSGKVDAVKIKELYLNDNKKELKLPITVTEKAVYDIFKRLLPYNQICIEEDFFSLGMDSILTLRTTHELKKRFGIKIKGSHFYEFNTIEKLSNCIDQIILDEDCEINKGYYRVNYQENNKDILFLISPLTGCSVIFKTLKPFVPETLDLIVFDAFDLDKYKDLGETLEKMASFYTDVVCDLSKDKMVHLAGWSFGASVTYAVATQLQDLGHKIPTLILMDPGFNTSDFDDGSKGKEDFVDIFNKLLIQEGLDVAELGLDISEQMFHANNLIRDYKPREFKGDISLIKPELVSDYERNFNKPYNGIDEFCSGKITVSSVPGNHMTMTSGPIKNFAEVIFSKVVR